MKKKGIIGGIISLITFIIVGGFFIAILKRFDWDIFALGEYILNWIVYGLERVSEFFLGTPTFNEALR